MKKLTAAVTRLSANANRWPAWTRCKSSTASAVCWPAAHFAAASASWINQIIASDEGHVPGHCFLQGTHGNWDDLVDTGANVLGVDWTVRLADVRARLPEHVGVQGNLDPSLLATTPEVVAAETRADSRDMRGRPAAIFSTSATACRPTAKLENISRPGRRLVKNFK